MSNPISSVPNQDSSSEDLDRDVGEDFAADSVSPLLEMDDAGPETPSSRNEPTDRRSVLALVLAAVLLGSVAINLKQSRDVAHLEARSQEYQQALAAAVERIDEEAARADAADAALDRVDRAVDVVNERALGLREALDQLREATLR